MYSTIGFANTGQVVFFRYIPDLMHAAVPEISSAIFKKLRENIASVSMHTKPVTEGCWQAASVRVTNELEVGIPVRFELKSRIFMAQTIDNKPIIIASNYWAHTGPNLREMQNLMPKDKKGNFLIKLPSIVPIKKDEEYDLLDTFEVQNSPYSAAANSLRLGMGQINPYAVMLRAERIGIKVLYMYDRELFTEKHPLATNIGHRNLGIFVEDGREYSELAVASAKPIIIGGSEYKGAVIGKFAHVMRNYKEAPIAADAYRAAGMFEQVVNKAMNMHGVRQILGAGKWLQN